MSRLRRPWLELLRSAIGFRPAGGALCDAMWRLRSAGLLKVLSQARQRTSPLCSRLL